MIDLLRSHFDRLDLWWLLLSLPVLGLIFLWEAARARRELRRWASDGLRRRLLGAQPGWRRGLRRSLWMLALLLGIVGALRPRWGFKSQKVQHVGVDIAILLDVSRSMLVPDIPPNRLRAAITDISALMERLRGGRVALVPFAGLAFVQSALTHDKEVIRQYLAELRVADMPVPGTDLGDALRLGMKALGVGPEVRASDGGVEIVHRYRGSKHKAIILLTDGEDFGGDLEDALTDLRDAGVPVFTVGVGTAAGKPIPVLDEDGDVKGVQKDQDGKPVFSEINEELLERIARETSGAHFSLEKGSIVDAVYAQIDRLEKREYEDMIANLREDRYAWFVLAALLLLLLEPLIREERRPRGARAGAGPGGASAVLLLLSLAALSIEGCSLDRPPFVVESGAINEALEKLGSGEANAALALVQEARKDLSDRPELDLDEALALLAVGKPGDAVPKLQRALERAPASQRTRILYALGLAHAHQGLALEASLKEGGAAKPEPPSGGGGEKPDEPDAATVLRSWVQARDLFEEVLRREPGHDGARRGLEVALYRTDPPCHLRDADAEPDEAPHPPHALELDPKRFTAEAQGLLCPDDADRFAFTLPAGARLFARLDTLPPKKDGPSGADPDGRALLKPTGSPELEAATGGTRIEGQVATRDQQAVLGVVHADPEEGEVAYALKIQVLPSCALLDGEEQRDDRPGAAQRVDGLREAPMRLCPGDRDHFAVELTEGYSLIAVVDVADPPPDPQGKQSPPGRGPRVPGQPKDLPPEVRILDLDGKVVAEGFGTVERRLAVAAEPGAGGYVVQVSAPEQAPRLETPYRITVSLLPPCPDGNLDDMAASAEGKEPNGGPDQATPLQAGTVTLARVCPGDTDWFAVQADEKKPTQVEVLFDRARADLKVDGYLSEDLVGDPATARAIPAGALFPVPKKETATAPKVRVRGASPEAEGLYLIRHVATPKGQPKPDQKKSDPDEKKGDEGKKNGEEKQEPDGKPRADRKQPKPAEGDEGKQPKPRAGDEQKRRPQALEQLLQRIDRNRRNLQAEEAARKAHRIVVPGGRDW